MTSRLLKLAGSILLVAAVFVVASRGIGYCLRFFAQPASLADSEDGLQRAAKGARLAIDGVKLDSAPWSVVLVTSPACVFCQASKGFHRTLAEVAAKRQIPFYVALPSGTDSTFIGFPRGSKPVDIEWRQLRIRLQGTPTVLLVDGSGTIGGIWAGRLREDRAAELLDKIQQLPLPEAPEHPNNAGAEAPLDPITTRS